MSPSLIDTDTLSEYLKGVNPWVRLRANEYLEQFSVFSFSLITRYEILRGLKAKHATTQLQHFERFCAANQVMPLTDVIIVRAADLYADLRQQGRLISDADLLIAATAMTHELTLVTNNTAHFSRIRQLALDCWTTP